MNLRIVALALLVIVTPAFAGDLDRTFGFGTGPGAGASGKSEPGFDEKYQRDYNIFAPTNQLRPDNPLNPINSVDPDNPFNPINSVDPGNPANPLNQYNPNNPLNPINKVNPDNPLNPINRYNPDVPFEPLDRDSAVGCSRAIEKAVHPLAEESMLREDVVREVLTRLTRGGKIKTIARTFGIDRKTIKRWRRPGRWQPRQGPRRPAAWDPAIPHPGARLVPRAALVSAAGE